MAHKIIMTDGTRTETIYKSLNPWDETTPGVWSPDPSDLRKQARANRLVPSIFAGINTRMQAMGDLPFTVYSVKGDKELDSSDNYQNVIGFLPQPSVTFALAEGSLTTYGKAYWYKGKGTMTGAVKELKYWQPESVAAEIDKAGVITFKRPIRPEPFKIEEVLYMWSPDPAVEVGPPTVWPLESALIAAEANGTITSWVRDYMRRGAIKAMLLAVEGVPPPGEVEKIESWFNRFMSGARGLVWKVFNFSAVKPTIIGDGLEALKDLSINKELRYEIHTALGTRHLLEDENYATASARERQFYTQIIVPDARVIQTAFNEQILHAAGLHIEFEPERLEIFQTNEAEQTKAFGDLFGIFKEVLPVEIAFRLASEKLDYEFTEEQQALIVTGIAEKKASAEKVQQQIQQGAQEKQPQDQTPPEVVKALVELDKWEAKVGKAGKMVTWHALDLAPEMVKAIKDGGMTFDQARAELKPPVLDEKRIMLTVDAVKEYLDFKVK